jgi:hypothetical protein
MLRRLTAVVAGGEGFLLLEVLIALLFLALLLGPLLNGVLVTTRRADALKQSAITVGSDGAGDAALASWGWGYGLTRAIWRPGPELILQSSDSGGQTGCRVGLWIGGWFVQEYDTGDTRSLNLGAAIWCGRSGQEVVLRSRMPGSPWGPPWRTEVPPADGVVVVAAPAPSSADRGSACWAMHEPSATSATPALSWRDVKGSILDMPAPFIAGLPPSGVRQSRLDTLDQAWTQEEGRELDVYY